MSDHQSETDRELEEVLGSHRTVIKIIGAGGAGNNTVTRLLEVGIRDVDVIAINTDAQDLLYAKSDYKILIGKNITNGLGAGSDPVKGEESARESLEDIESKLAGSDMVFITCGLGGGTGTGSAPIIAGLAQKVGALTIAVVTLPFSDEGVVRWENARKGLQELKEHVDTVIVVQNDRLLELVPDMPLNAAFKVADEILVNAVKGITELVTEKGLVNLDFADLRTIMVSGGLAMIGLGESDSEMNAEDAAEKALQNPLLDVDITGAKSALINISGGQEFSLKAAKTIMRIVAKKLDPTARIIWGARIDETMGASLRVMLIVTCLQSSRKTASDIEVALMGASGAEDMHTPTDVVEGAQSSSGEATVDNKKAGSRVFAEIFMEESDSDLNLLEDAITGLSFGKTPENEALLRDIRAACTAIHGSSELFGYDKISNFVELVGDVTEFAAEGEFELSKSVLELYCDVPSTLRSIMTEDEIAYEKADEIKHKFANILELLTQSRDAEPESDGVASPHEDSVPETAAAIRTTEAEVEAASSSSPDDDKKSEFSNVREAVKYFDKLF